MKNLIKYIWACSLILTVFIANATHIVGGDITYEYVSENTYRINLFLYVDCINGTTGAINSDKEANIAYFNAETNEFISNDALDVITQLNVEEVNYKCLKVEPNACVQQFKFSYIKIINPRDHGIIIAFQRCCRNRTISNIQNPENTGATFFVKLPPKNIVKVNSSAVFEKLPPNFLCTNAPLVFDHKAFDKDGDSLVYSLILPYIGATADEPRPIPASKPPYANILMKGQYGVRNMMNGTVLLQINSLTGELRVTPSEAGQFVVAVKVEEYRNGVKIAEGFRDYQLNVIDCDFDVIANFSAPDKTCDWSVSFENLSVGSALHYRWDFGDYNSTDDQATTKNAKWEYSSVGKYRVRLIVFNDGCRDSFFKDLNILPSNYIYAKFDAMQKEGCDTLRVILNNQSDSASNFRWDMGDGVVIPINENIEEYLYTKPGRYTISLNLHDTNTCNITDDSSIVVEVFPSKHIDAGFKVNYKKGCSSNGIVNIEGRNTASSYTWDLGDGTVWKDEFKSFYKYKIAGEYTIRLETSDTGKCIFNDSFEMNLFLDNVIAAEKGIQLYNVFSPDGDAFNSCFRLDAERTQCLDVDYKIFNRWGELVFESHSLYDCWDGTNNRSGNALPAGEYFGVYLFKVKGTAKKIKLSNVITLIR
ncbi:MAG: hypothetical protein COA58_03125 [Bacteroidetes bacterium]|nr:MAG: hypothetical protein COA58_03125 [Bacteroidota bacterium]